MTLWLQQHPSAAIAALLAAGVLHVFIVQREARRWPEPDRARHIAHLVRWHATLGAGLVAGSTLLLALHEALAAATGPIALLVSLPVFPLADVVASRAGTQDATLATVMLGLAGMGIAHLFPRLLGDRPPPSETPSTHSHDAVGATLVVVGALVLLGLMYLVPWRAPGTAVLPGVLWGLLVSQVAWLFAWWRAARPVPADPPPPAPGARPTDRPTRQDWEQAMERVGAVLSRQVWGEPPRVGQTPRLDEADGDIPLETEDAGAHPSRLGSAAPGSPSRAQAEDRAWRTFDVSPWTHQARFLSEVLATLEVDDPSEGDLSILDTESSSGRTTAVLVTAHAAWRLKGRRTIILYPDTDHLDRARRLSITTRLEETALLGVDLAPTDRDAAPIVAVSASDLVTALADPARRRRVLAGVGLIVIEDAEHLSGTRASNLALILRRLARLARLARTPAFAVTLTAVRTDDSAVLAFAQRVAGAHRIRFKRPADRTPRPRLHGYVVDRPFGRAEAGEIDAAPELLVLAWWSRSRGFHVSVRHVDSTTIDQLEPPNWQHDDAVPWARDPAHARVSMWAVGARDALLLPDRIGHAGMQNPGAPDHLAVVQPLLANHAVLRWMTHVWLRSTDRNVPSGPWRGDLRPLGSRLVCGIPSNELLREHLLAAIQEQPGTREELERTMLLPAMQSHPDRSSQVQTTLDELYQQGRIAPRTIRRLDRDGGARDGARHDIIEEEVYDIVRPAPELALRPPDLDAWGGPRVRLIHRGALFGGGRTSVLAEYPLPLLLRAAYPGRRFIAEHLNRDGNIVRRTWEVGAWQPDDGTWTRATVIDCRPAETAYQTVPDLRWAVRSRTLSPAWTRILPCEGAPIERRLGTATLDCSFHGHIQLDRDPSGHPAPTRRFQPGRAEGIDWTHQLAAEVVQLSVDIAPPSTAGRALLEAMLQQMLAALTQLDDELPVVLVEPSEPTVHEDATDDPGRDEAPTRTRVWIVDVLNGACDTLAEALDDNRVLDWLRATWIWVHDLASPDTTVPTPSWGDLDPTRTPADEEPPFAEIDAWLTSLLGDEARTIEQIPPTTLPIAHVQRPTEAPLEHQPGQCAACGIDLEPGDAVVRYGHLPALVFCTTCTYERAICDFCATPAGPSPTRYRDGRETCVRCEQTAVRSEPHARRLLAQALDMLGPLGVRPTHDVALKLVDAAALARDGDGRFQPTRHFDPRTVGRCVSPQPRLAGAPPPDGQRCTIFMEDGHPEQDFVGTLCHELVHAWQWEQFPAAEIDPRWIEGLAVWVDVQILEQFGRTEVAELARKRTDPVYGEGYRWVADLATTLAPAQVAGAVLDAVTRGQRGAPH